MSANAAVDSFENMVRGPWHEPARAPAAAPAPGAAPVPPRDPRLDLSEQALALANTNAFPVVARNNKRSDKLGLAAGAAVALALGFATFASMRSHGHAPAVPGARAAIGSQATAALPLAAPTVPANTALTPGLPAPGTAAGASPAPGHAMAPDAGLGRTPGAMTMPGTARGSAPVMVYDGSSGRMVMADGNADSSAGAQGTPAMLGGGSLAGGAASSDNNAVRATKLADPSNSVVQGTLIPAVLETAINTDVPGYARAVVSQDVKSFDGSRVLIPRSSRLIGEYKGVTEAGQRRAYLMWTRLVRPDGVSIALASPAADFSGQAGIGGQVNSHFLSRFGSSILLSIIGGAGSLISGGASTVVVSGGQSAASVAAQHDGNRPPTIKVQQGEPIRVFTARDLIFPDGARG